MISDSQSSNASRLSSDFEDVAIEYEGKRYTAQQIIASIPKIVEYISKIEGNIDPTNTRLSDYKRTTEVFSTAIVKRETNQFKAR